VFLHWLDASGREIGLTVALDSLNGTSLWEKTATTVTPPAHAVKAAVEVRVRTNGAG
jgi:hypothetical protein